MKKASLPVHPREIAVSALKALPSPRLREVLERRFGLRGKEPETLEGIGRSFGVTRERVRQIEADSLRYLSRPAVVEILSPVSRALENHFSDHGHVFEESKLLHSIAEPRYANHAYFLLTIAKPFSRRGEDGEWHDRWYTREDALKASETIMIRTADELAAAAQPVSAAELFAILKKQAKDVLGSVPNPDTLESYLNLSKRIKQNPYGEFGLVSWATIRPRGVKDKAYAVVAKAGNPLHFREVASGINKAGWSAKKAHPQTVHNELIKDPRFVLVGRGLYALAEWGYEPGTVGDVITSILKSTRRPLGKEEIVKRVLEKRFVKPNTILLNLQNKELFTKAKEGYTLV